MTDTDKTQMNEITPNTEGTMSNLKNICNCRLAVGVLVAVVLIGSYVLITAINSPTLQALPFLIFLVCFVAAIIGIMYYFSSSRKSKRGCSKAD